MQAETASSVSTWAALLHLWDALTRQCHVIQSDAINSSSLKLLESLFNIYVFVMRRIYLLWPRTSKVIVLFSSILVLFKLSKNVPRMYRVIRLSALVHLDHWLSP